MMLASCGLQPMYAGGASGEVGRAISSVVVSPIEGKAGYLVRNALTDRLGAAGKSEARYRLDVRLDEKLAGMIVQSDDSVSRERRVMRARYQLVDLNTGAVILDDTADIDAGIDIVKSEYAVIAAEQTAQENLSQDLANQIVTRISGRLRQRSAAPAKP
ncbi:LPS assembly lipoprotein LptE [Novosphingobium sp.]|uniref:LPS assembly lipoprotein LptE n=1 Tax=Novosphingobium sp. TaxID=1874826 RepID=UPI003B519F99